MRAVGYARVSTREQAQEGVSLEAQREQIAAYCKARDWALAEVLSDEGVSGATLEGRAGLQQAVALLDTGEAQVIVVTRLDRLSRTVRHILELVEERFAHNGARLVSIHESLDGTTALGRFALTLLAGLAQLEREQASERTIEALAHVRAQGRYLGALPYGYRRDEGGCLVRDEEQQRLLRRARALRGRGMSWAKLAEAMQWTVSQCRTRLDGRYKQHTRRSRGRDREG